MIGKLPALRLSSMSRLYFFPPIFSIMFIMNEKVILKFWKCFKKKNKPNFHKKRCYGIRLGSPAAAKSLQLCPTLCDPIDSSPPGSAVPGMLQARTLEWVAISFSNAWKWKVKVKSLSHVWLFATPQSAAYQVLPSMGFSRQGYWSGLPLPSPSHAQCLQEFGANSDSLCLEINNFPSRHLANGSLFNSTGFWKSQIWLGAEGDGCGEIHSHHFKIL